MAKHRSLLEGMKSSTKVDPKKEEAFVYGGQKSNSKKPKKSAKPKAKPKPAEPIPTPKAETETKPKPAESSSTLNVESEVKPEPAPKQILGRSPLTTRLRTDIGEALKRASLQRELDKQPPHTVQDILEYVLEPWLKEHGYLK